MRASVITGREWIALVHTYMCICPLPDLHPLPSLGHSPQLITKMLLINQTEWNGTEMKKRLE